MAVHAEAGDEVCPDAMTGLELASELVPEFGLFHVDWRPPE